MRITKFLAILTLLIGSVCLAQPSDATDVFNRNLGYGSRGEDVRELQRFLNTHGFSLAASGYGSAGHETAFFGPLTRASLIRFQTAKRIIPITGVLGPRTRTAINALLAPAPTFPIGGTVTGNGGIITLRLNNLEEQTVSLAGTSSFTFPTRLASGTSYVVLITEDGAGQACAISNNIGTVAARDIADITISCQPTAPAPTAPRVRSIGRAPSREPSFTCGNVFTDQRDSQSYDTTRIGDQCWMAENLNYGTRVDGSANQADADGEIIEKYCYGDDPDLCLTGGGLYQWHTALALPQACDNHLATEPCIVSTPSQGICPDGWHLPTFEELKTAARTSDPECDLNCDSGLCSCITAGLKMKADPEHLPIGWDGTDIYRFALLPSGIRQTDGSFARYGVSTNLWSATPLGGNATLSWFTSFFGTGNPYDVPPDGMYGGLNSRTYGYSVRCIKH